jgi:hypothetical protein
LLLITSGENGNMRSMKEFIALVAGITMVTGSIIQKASIIMVAGFTRANFLSV